MLRPALLVTALVVSGCDFNPEKAFDLLSGRETNLVVLAKQPTLLTPETTTLTSEAPMKVIGESTSLCISLRGGVPLQDSKVMDQAFKVAMQNAKVKVHVILASGDRVALHQPLLAWSMYGKIIKHDELSACASTPCTAELPVGAQVSKIEVSSEPALQVQGIYWQSERAPLEKSAPPATTAAASAPKAKSSCAG